MFNPLEMSKSLISLTSIQRLIFTAWLLISDYAYADIAIQENLPGQETKRSTNAECRSGEVRVPAQSPDKLSTQRLTESLVTQQTNNTIFSCLVPAKNIYSDWKSGTALLVDVRDRKLYNRNKIPDSINLPLYELKFKEGLKNRNIVLVDKGARLSILEKSCLALKTYGFRQISVMQDGLKAWNDAGYPVTGDRLSIQGLSDLTPSEFLNTLIERDWAFIDLDHSAKELHNLISVPGIIEYSDDIGSLREKMDAFKAARKSGVTTGFLVVSRDGSKNGIAKRQFLDSGIKNVYYLSGGAFGFGQFIQKHAAQIERLRKGFQVRMGCNG